MTEEQRAPVERDGEHTERLKTVTAQAVREALQPRQRTTAEVIAAFVSEAVLVGFVAALALTTQDSTFRYLALAIAAGRLGVSLKSITGGGGNGGPPTPGPTGALMVSLFGSLFARGAHHVAALLLGIGLAVPVAACSANAVRVQAVVANTIATSSNTALDLIAGFEDATATHSIYEREQLDAIEAACGNVDPCADPQAAREAWHAVRSRWAPVWSAWSLAGVAVTLWSEQLRKCQLGQSNDGECSVRLEALQRSAVAQLKTVRCALRAINVPDPFPEANVSCGGGRDE